MTLVVGLALTVWAGLGSQFVALLTKQIRIPETSGAGNAALRI